MTKTSLNTFYKIENNLNGCFYYGVHKTNDPSDGYMGSGVRICNAIKKYGKENFTKNVLKYFDTYEQALEYEAEFVNETLLQDPSCYNLITGGRGGLIHDRTGEKHSEETKRLISKIRVENNLAKGSNNGMYNKGYLVSGSKNGSYGKGNTKGKKWKVVNRKPTPKVICPKCGKMGAPNTMYRFHFDNCGVPNEAFNKKMSDVAKDKWNKIKNIYE